MYPIAFSPSIECMRHKGNLVLLDKKLDKNRVYCHYCFPKLYRLRLKHHTYQSNNHKDKCVYKSTNFPKNNIIKRSITLICQSSKLHCLPNHLYHKYCDHNTYKIRQDTMISVCGKRGIINASIDTVFKIFTL